MSDAVNFMSQDYIFFVFPIGTGHTYIDMLRYLTPYNSNISLELAVDSLLYIPHKNLKDISLLVEKIYVCDRSYGGILKHFDRNKVAAALGISADEITDDFIISLEVLVAMGIVTKEIVEEGSKLVRVKTPPETSILSSSRIRESNASHMIAIQSDVPSSSSKADLPQSLLSSNDPSKVKLLLEHGADVAITNNAGETAIDCAREIEKLDVNRKLCIELLEEAMLLKYSNIFIDQSKL